MKRLILLSLLFASPALAQQQQQQLTSHQRAMMEMGQQIGLLNSIVADLRDKNESLTRENADLRKQIEDSQKK